MTQMRKKRESLSDLGKSQHPRSQM